MSYMVFSSRFIIPLLIVNITMIVVVVLMMKEVVMMALPLKNKFFDFFLIFLLDDDYGKCARSVGKLILIRWEESRWDNNDDHQSSWPIEMMMMSILIIILTPIVIISFIWVTLKVKKKSPYNLATNVHRFHHVNWSPSHWFHQIKWFHLYHSIDFMYFIVLLALSILLISSIP